MIELDQLPPHILNTIYKENSNINSYLIALIPISILLIAVIYIYSNKSTINESKQKGL